MHVSPFPSPIITFIANSFPCTYTFWFPDSSASYHVTDDAKNLQQLNPIEGHDQIYIGNGQDLHTHSTGYSTFYSPFHPHTSHT